MDSENRVQNQSLAEPRSESKVLVGQKRDITGAEELSDNSHRRLKLPNGDSHCPSKAQAGELDLNANIGVDAPAYYEEPIAKEEKNRGFDLDLNAEDTSSSINNDPFYPFKNYEHLKSRDDSECGSSVGPPEEKDPLQLWRGLKENNYMTGRHGAVPMSIPKTRGRKKNNNDVTKKKIELAKKEHVDRFAKVAAPSGLLNGLNPGIINHVRNRKQVHSIIEALVKSKNTESQQCGEQIKNGAGDHGLFAESNYLNSEVTRGYDDSCMRDTRVFERMASNVKTKDDDGLALKLSSTVASENTSCLSNEESGNLNSVNSLSLKAANVASQWLELLNQDIKGRLAALRRSKKRVRTVIVTELPHLISREFSTHLHDKATADAHAFRWNNLFGQMDKTLSEEEIHLENWLNQVKEMQLHCEKGLYGSFYSASHEIGPMGNNDKSEAYNPERDLAVKAAAASIYSTCNYLLSMDNLPTCQLSEQ